MSPTRILITGASSGLGAELARAYAAPGRTLVLCGRNRERLSATAENCRRKGAAVEESCFDLRDVGALAAQLQDLDRRFGFDLAIFNAGVGGVAPAEHAVEPAQFVFEVATVNFTATLVAATAVAEGMAQRGRGHIVLIGSIAESFPLPMAPAYAGAKAGLRMFAEALELRLRRDGVTVSLVSPGFIDTPMSRGLASPKPFLLTAERAAAIIVSRLAKGSRRMVVPRSFAVVRAFASLLPRAVTGAVLARMWQGSRPR